MENSNVTTDAKPTFGAGSEASFSDIEAITERSAKKAEPKKEKAKAEPKAPDKPKAKSDEPAPENRESRTRSEPKGKAKPEPKAAQPKGEPKDAEASTEEQGSAESPEKKPAKRYKAKTGDSFLDLPGDAMIPVTINGEDIEISVEDLRSNYSGKVAYDKKFSEVDRERKAVHSQRDEMNKLVETLYDKVTNQKDGEAAFDFLANLTGQDPVQLKLSVLKQQYEEMLPLFQLEDGARDEWWKNRELHFRERAVKSKEDAFKQTETDRQKAAQLLEKQQRYGISEDRYAEVEKALEHHFAQKNEKQEITPEHVVWADRTDVALRAIRDAASHLEQHAEFDSIVTDIVAHLVRHPELSASDVEKLLRENFADEGDKATRRLSKKAAEADSVGAREIPRRQEAPGSKKKPLFFEDM